VALAATAAAALLRYVVEITLEPQPPLFVIFLGAVGVAAWFGGFGPGLLSTALGCLLGLYFIEPVFRLAIESPHDLIDTAIFAVIGVAISGLCELLHIARTNAETWSRELLQVSAAERAWKDRYEAAVRASGHVLYDLDCVAGRVTFAGPCERVFGYTSGELGGDLTRWSDLLHPADRPAYHRITPARQAAEGLLETEYRVRHRRGHDLTIHDVGQPIRGTNGEVTRVVGFLKDVTEQRRAELAMRASEERLRLAVAATGIGVTDATFSAASSGLDAVRLDWTPEAKAIAGLPVDAEVTLDTVLALLHPDDLPAARKVLAASLARDSAGVYQLECRILRPGEAPRWVSCHGRTLFEAAAGGPTRSIGIIQDITDRKRAEEALCAADQRKDDFIATLAHELRNPLAPIRHAVALLHSLPDAEPRRSAYVAVIDRQVANMARLLDDLLDMSRITSGKLELRRARVDVAEIVERAVETARPVIEAKHHTLEIIAPPAVAHVDADLARLTQVLANLLVNAAKYTERGGSIRVGVGVARQGHEVEISVQDSGIGLAAEHVSRIFEMFSQVSSALERSQGGLGIGLALSRGLVEIHGGTIEARSAGPGRGCEFIVRLPLAEAPRPESPRGAPGGRPGPLGCRILVADDNADNAETLAMLLGLHGGDVRVAHDGAEAVAVAVDFRPQVAILDIGMPMLNGYAVCQRIRAEPWGREVTLIAQTGWAQEEDRRRSREAGFDLHITKPVAPDDLLGLIAGLQRGRAGATPA
jgi:PAS domain S-box-containing protein